MLPAALNIIKLKECFPALFFCVTAYFAFLFQRCQISVYSTSADFTLFQCSGYLRGRKHCVWRRFEESQKKISLFSIVSHKIKREIAT